MAFERMRSGTDKVDEQVINIYWHWGMGFWCVDMEEVPTTAVQYYDGGIPSLEHTLQYEKGAEMTPTFSLH
ncbi:MAG: hypothetical protein ACI9UN_004721 [Granulosicoccus sp.]|jgi:hypothetical protein